MKNLKKENGITMLTLIITIIILLVLASITINIGSITIKKVNDSKLISELEMVQHAVLEQYTKYKTTKDISYLVGYKLTDEEVTHIANENGITLVNIPDTYINKDYYKLDKNDLKKIGIENTEYEYIINYISGEVINITVTKLSNDDLLYTKANNF